MGIGEMEREGREVKSFKFKTYLIPVRAASPQENP
jgi:hypothetical protein